MASRLLRGDLLESDRWLGLAHPAERLAFVVLLLTADDLGCLEASDGALVRRWRDPCGIKGREDALKVLGALADADLVRTYDVAGKRYLFIPRFRQRFRARALKHPAPPPQLVADDPAIIQNISEIQQYDLAFDGNSRTDGGNARSDDGLGVGVGVGEVVVEDVGVGVSAPPRAQPAVLLSFPLKGGGQYQVTKEFVSTLEPLYPAVDVPQTLNEMKGWLLGNPERLKTRGGIKRFITNWLKEEQSRHGG
jgi:hypothetical protein